jgi:hypothetical protein
VKYTMETGLLEPLERSVIRLETAEVKLPILYQEAQAMWAFFPAQAAPLKALLPDRRLKLVPLIPGFTLVGVACFEYKHCELGPYQEVGVFFPVRYRPVLNLPLIALLFEESYKDLDVYLHRLPVTTPLALEVGQRLWGYPKFIAEISFEEAGGWRTCRLMEAGQLILELSVKLPPPGPTRQRTFTTFSLLEGRLLMAAVNVQASMHSTRSPKAAQLTLGPHPYGEELKAWRLGAWAAETRFFAHMQLRLNAPHRAEPVQGG